MLFVSKLCVFLGVGVHSSFGFRTRVHAARYVVGRVYHPSGLKVVAVERTRSAAIGLHRATTQLSGRPRQTDRRRTQQP
eukprot:scaffold20134_cov66-Phaeocystis_antarctica.AAC.6